MRRRRVDRTIGRLLERGPSDRGWLVRDGQVLASLEIPLTRRGKALGLIGRDGVDGAMLLRPARSVHSFGMRFELDVAFVDADGVVVRTLRLHRHRITPPVWRARAVIEAEAGAFGTWELKIGDEVEIRLAAESPTPAPSSDPSPTSTPVPGRGDGRHVANGGRSVADEAAVEGEGLEDEVPPA